VNHGKLAGGGKNPFIIWMFWGVFLGGPLSIYLSIYLLDSCPNNTTVMTNGPPSMMMDTFFSIESEGLKLVLHPTL
jgi:hypothetical protein